MYSLFVITRNRPSVLKNTIEEIFNQTLPPQSVLIVDNSDNEATLLMYEQANDSRLQYHKVGYNSGPAGGAKIGMEILFEQGYEWVVWGDDDDPPKFNDVIERLFLIIPKIDISTIGIIGCLGTRFNLRNGLTLRLPDNDLNGLLEVDSISGGMFPMLHRNLYNQNIFPNPDLFFGFEELDFCLAVKRAKLKIFVSGDEIYRHRLLHGRLDLIKKYKVKSIDSLWREYYSTRNIIYILLRKEKAYSALAYITLRTCLKMFYMFRFGLKYGKLNFHYLSKGLYDGYRNRMGMTILPISKSN
ncbi:MAG: glycosyltransferase [Flavobacterium sp.]|nr:glycosyltransferase [Flavobacterium sp.]